MSLRVEGDKTEERKTTCFRDWHDGGITIAEENERDEDHRVVMRERMNVGM
jgi:hypothetical protein